MEEHSASKGDKRINIFINDERYSAPREAMTGGQLKELGGVPAGNRLFLEKPGPAEDEPIGDEQLVELQSGMRFYDLPPMQVGYEL